MNSLNSPWLVILFLVILFSAFGFIVYVVYTLIHDADKRRKERALHAKMQEEKNKEKQNQGNLFRTIMEEAKKNQEQERKKLEEKSLKRAEDEVLRNS